MGRTQLIITLEDPSTASQASPSTCTQLLCCMKKKNSKVKAKIMEEDGEFYPAEWDPIEQQPSQDNLMLT
jgi:hypothetical protein